VNTIAVLDLVSRWHLICSCGANLNSGRGEGKERMKKEEKREGRKKRTESGFPMAKFAPLIV
jgi:hypothetical protein